MKLCSIDYVGGKDGKQGKTRYSSSEVFEDGAFRTGPVLPVEVDNHCMVKVNETHALIAGGLPFSVSQGNNVSCFKGPVAKGECQNRIGLWRVLSPSVRREVKGLSELLLF